MFKKTAAIALALIAITGVATFAYDLTPADYINTNFDIEIPLIAETFAIATANSITLDNLALLDLFFSDNQMLAWQAKLAEGPITSWIAVYSLQYHAFEKDGTPKEDRRVVTGIKSLILHLFFHLGE